MLTVSHSSPQRKIIVSFADTAIYTISHTQSKTPLGVAANLYLAAGMLTVSHSQPPSAAAVNLHLAEAIPTGGHTLSLTPLAVAVTNWKQPQPRSP